MIDDIHIKLFDEKEYNFQAEIRDALTTTKNVFAKKETEYILNAADFALIQAANIVPYASLMRTILSKSRSLLAKESDWKRPLAEVISDGTMRSIFEQETRNMDASLEVIGRNVDFLLRSSAPQNRTAMMTVIYNDIEKILHQFSHENSIFRSYPQRVVPNLLLFATIVASFEPLKRIIDPELAKFSDTTCKLNGTLQDYRQLVIRDRLLQVILLDERRPYILTTCLYKTLSKAYDKNAYESRSTIGCKERDDKEHNSDYFEDPISDHRYSAYGNDDDYEAKRACLAEYMELLKFRIDTLFQNATDFIQATCRKSPRETGIF